MYARIDLPLFLYCPCSRRSWYNISRLLPGDARTPMRLVASSLRRTVRYSYSRLSGIASATADSGLTGGPAQLTFSSAFALCEPYDMSRAFLQRRMDVIPHLFVIWALAEIAAIPANAAHVKRPILRDCGVFAVGISSRILLASCGCTGRINRTRSNINGCSLDHSGRRGVVCRDCGIDLIIIEILRVGDLAVTPNR